MKKIYLMVAVAAMLSACEKNSGGGTETQKDKPNELTYEGVTYKTVTLADGSVWMAENLRYVPEGKTVSEDPSDKSGVWYPYEIKDGAAVALKDEVSIKEKGYLYSFAAAVKEEITVDNLKSFEGAQGICPEGWHIPTRADWTALLGFSQKGDGEDAVMENTEAVYYDDEYKGGRMTALMDPQGLALQVTGYVNQPYSKAGEYAKIVTTADNCSVESLVGLSTMTYYLCSTGYKVTYKAAEPDVISNMQLFGAMVMFSPSYKDGKVTCGYNNHGNGCPLRCVKDAE